MDPNPPKPGKHVASSTAAAAWSIFGTGFTITDAFGINDSGQILCNATNASGNEHAVLLTRNRPEPQATREHPNPAGTEGSGDRRAIPSGCICADKHP
jgi:hypothetical protein